MRLTLLGALCWLACHASPAKDTSELRETPAETRESNTPNDAITFDDVLRIALSRSPSAHDQLTSISRNTTVDSEVRHAASRIVLLWNDDERTYFSAVPLPLHRECVDAVGLGEIRKLVKQTTHVDFELTIDSAGRVRDALVRRSSGQGEVDNILQAELRRRRFLPAKPQTDLIDGTTRLTCWIEAR